MVTGSYVLPLGESVRTEILLRLLTKKRADKILARFKTNPFAVLQVRRVPATGGYVCTVGDTPLKLQTFLCKLHRDEVVGVCAHLDIPHGARKVALVRNIANRIIRAEAKVEEKIMAAPRVFISYSHDSPEHSAAVLKLADDLRQQGIDAMLDQYVSSPDEGWPRWILGQIEKANHVLLICSPQYKKRFEGDTRGDAGRGVNFEGAVATTILYSAHGLNNKFVPVLLEGGTEEDVPAYLRQWTVYRPSIDQRQLVDRLLGRPSKKVARIVELPSRQAESLGAFSATTPRLLELKVDASIEVVASRLGEIRTELRRIVKSDAIDVVELRRGSTILIIDGDPQVVEEFRKRIETGEVKALLGLDIKVVPRSPPARKPPWLQHQKLRKLAVIAKELKIDRIRGPLLNSLPEGVRERLGHGNGVPPTIVEDLNLLNEMPRLRDGSIPVLLWVEIVREHSGEFSMDEFDAVVKDLELGEKIA